MNSVILFGRMTKDPEVRYTNNQTAIVRFTLAVNRMKKDDPADFISCIAFGKTAELIGNYMSKGSQMGVQGRIQTGSYEKDGQKVFTTDVVVDRIEFTGSGKSERAAAPEPVAEGFEAMDSDIPF